MQRGRPLSFSPEIALGAATATFWSRGFEACSLQDLLEATQLSKSSLYQRFGNKEQLFDQCLLNYTAEMEKLLRQTLQFAPTGKAFIQMVLAQVINEPQPARGCLIFNTANEFGQANTQINQRINTSLERFRQVFLEALQQDKDQGLLQADAQPEVLADFILSSIGGLRGMVKVGRPKQALQHSVDVVLQAIY